MRPRRREWSPTCRHSFSTGKKNTHKKSFRMAWPRALIWNGGLAIKKQYAVDTIEVSTVKREWSPSCRHCIHIYVYIYIYIYIYTYIYSQLGVILQLDTASPYTIFVRYRGFEIGQRIKGVERVVVKCRRYPVQTRDLTPAIWSCCEGWCRIVADPFPSQLASASKKVHCQCGYFVESIRHQKPSQ